MEKIRCYDEFLSRFYFTLSWSLNLLICFVMFSVSKCDCKPTSVSLKLSYGAFFNAFFKMIRVSYEVSLHLTLRWKFKPFNKCFLSQNVTANFSLMLLQFSPCVSKTGGDNSNKGCLGSPMNNFMSSRKFRRPSRIFRWHSP